MKTVWATAVVVLAVLAWTGWAEATHATQSAVCSGPGKCVVKPGVVAGAAASGWFEDETETNGWGRVRVEAGGQGVDDVTAMFGAGFLEGFLTAERIADSYANFAADTFEPLPAALTAEIKAFCAASMAWSRALVASVNYSDPSPAFAWQYEAQVGLVLAQFDGMVAGYANAAAARSLAPLSDLDIFMLNSIGDMDDIVPAMRVQHPEAAEPGRATSGIDLSPARLAEIEAGSHCSLLLKVSEDGSQLFLGHEMWASYTQMLPAFKSYAFDLSLESTAARNVSFSSYYSFLSSEDDFYVLSSGLVVSETTNSVIDLDIYKLVTPESLLSWIRVVVANRMAKSGPEWGTIFTLYNSGTYNNQWNVIDMPLFTPGAPLAANTHVICSQIPGLVMCEDVSAVNNEQGYFPSYNVPFIPAIFAKLGYPAAVAKYGNVWTYAANPRANIFRARQSSVTDLASLQHLMRYNDWQNDPFSLGCPLFGLAARADLAPTQQKHEWGGLCSRQFFGAINAKITSSAMIAAGNHVAIIAGPTHQTEPVFAWPANATTGAASHVGQPAAFDFEWITVADAELL